MRIIKQGQLPQDKLYNHTCSNCKTEFEFLQREGTYRPDQRDGDSIEIACPVCNKRCFASVYRSDGR